MVSPSNLCRPVPDNVRARGYQEIMDRYLDRVKTVWDIDRGFRGSTGIRLPHETVDDYWELSETDRTRVTSAEAAAVYSAMAGRDGTATLGVAAFCYYSHLSQHHGDPKVLQFFQNGLATFTGSIRHDGVMASCGLNGKTWAHGWDVEGLLYGLAWCGNDLDPAIKTRALIALRRSADWFRDLGVAGDYGNQACVQTLALYLYGCVLEDQQLLRIADRYWTDIVDKVLDPAGQVIEQLGPCMHYSYTAFAYAWLNVFWRNQIDLVERMELVLLWFRNRHTRSMCPLAGGSSRKYNETLSAHIVDILAACEWVADRNPMLQKFADGILDRFREQRELHAAGHGCSPLLTATLTARDTIEPTAVHVRNWNAPFEGEYRRLRIMGRPGQTNYSPVRYALVRHRYQTQVMCVDFLPFSGLQTWAFEDEPPIIHPTLECPSTTRALGLDTARQGVSQNWAELADKGQANMPDHLLRYATTADETSFMLMRYSWLWRLIVFTECSTVMLECGWEQPRETLWTLNRVGPVTPLVAPNMVSFEERKGTMHTTVDTVPETHPGTRFGGAHDVTVLRYECGTGFSVFAFSDDSFRFCSRPDETGTFAFQDRDGQYVVTPAPDLPTNPGATFARFRIRSIVAGTKVLRQ